MPATALQSLRASVRILLASPVLPFCRALVPASDADAGALIPAIMRGKAGEQEKGRPVLMRTLACVGQTPLLVLLLVTFSLSHVAVAPAPLVRGRVRPWTYQHPAPARVPARSAQAFALGRPRVVLRCS
ncbi:hypothetical protein C8J57DRAFT_1513952 [Mycena rebaudengoi]|nr:hypothetical protein C8J57DRAFT_1513952 [Mycena rebaudengoi]